MRYLNIAARFALVAVLLSGLVLALVSWLSSMPGDSYTGRRPQSEAERLAIELELERHVQRLAESIGERNERQSAALKAARSYVEQSFLDIGWNCELEEFGRSGSQLANVVARAPRSGNGPAIVVAAHYDCAPGTPGADANASGVAVLLALARVWGTTPSAQQIDFVALAGGAPPLRGTDEMGSRVHARRLRSAGRKVEAVLVLEGVGSYTRVPGAQRWPLPLRFAGPERGDFAAFVGNLSSRALTQRVVAAFRAEAQLPSQGIALPALWPGLPERDVASYWREHVPAVWITDTGVWRNPRYAGPEDTAERLDYPSMALLVEGLAAALRELAQLRS
jgi:hypothetical protein